LPLYEYLKDKDYRVRKEAANALDKLRWKPSFEVDRAYYFIAKEEWDEVIKIGKAAIEPLTKTLSDERASSPAKKALEKIKAKKS